MEDRIRKGNDIGVSWAILADAENQVPYDLTGRRLTMYLTNRYGTSPISGFKTEGHIVKWTYYGKEQKQLGPYTLTLVENEGEDNMHTVDACNAFHLVARSCEATKGNENKVELVHLDLSSEMLAGAAPIKVDDELNEDSENAIQNKVVTQSFKDVAAAIEERQPVINDLENIRKGASLGATAVQRVKTFNGQDIEGEGNIEFPIDANLSEMSANPVQNKAVTMALNDKVSKEIGKGLSSEDFTATLKEKLDSLSNYDDSAIVAAINRLRSDLDNLVSGDTTKAINSYNDVIAFLAGIEDSKSLEGIIAAIEKQITAKQDEVADLDAIREGSAKGATAVQPGSLAAVATSGSYNDLKNKPAIPEIDTSALVTKEELAEAEEVAAAALNDLNEKKADKEYVEDALKNMDTSSLASKKELETLRNEVITNEEIVASSLNDLEERKADKEYVEQYVEDALGNVSVDTSTLVTKEEFADVEEVWAASYNLLNQKISDVQQYIYDEAASRRQFDEAIAEIQSIIAENESVVTAAWNQLNTRINALEAAQAQGE